MSSVIQDIIANTIGDGARTAKFACQIVIPEVFGFDDNIIDTICKSTSYPGKETELLSFLYKGRSIPLVGQEKFSQTIELTFYTEENLRTRVMFDKWMAGANYINYSDQISPESKSIKNQSYYTSSIVLHQLDFHNEKITASQILYNAFPINLSSINVDSTSINTIEEFTVTFAYSYFDEKNSENSNISNTANSSNTGSTGSSFADAIQAGTNRATAALGQPDIKTETDEIYTTLDDFIQ